MRGFRYVAACFVSASLGACAGLGGPEADTQKAPSAKGFPYVTANARAALGTNLSSLVDWSFEYPLVDVFKASRPWISGGPNQWDDGRAVAVDRYGWVTSLLPDQVARTLLFSEMHDPAPAFLEGDITLLYDGDGDFEISAGNDGITRAPGKTVVTFNPSKGGQFILNLTRTNPANPLRNFRAILPGGRCGNDGTKYCRMDSDCGAAVCVSFLSNYSKEPFHPVFLSDTKPYGAIRFMDLMVTNHSTIQHWADRPKMTDARWSTKGAPIELLAKLCNTLRVDGWFNVPHQADADYTRKLATTLNAHLASDRHVYVEYSNEVWNDIMGQSAFATQEGLRLGLSTDPFEARMLYHARRTVEVGRIFREVFGSARLTRVLGSFAAVPWVTERMLAFETTADEVDAVAIAPYFGAAYGSEPEVTTKNVPAMSVDALLSLLHTEELPRILAWVDGHRAAIAAKRPGLELLAYEGGQHLVGVGGHENDAALNTLFDAVNRAPEMEALYTEYLEGWKVRGGHRFMHFVNVTGQSKWGRWGALEYSGQQPTPKYRALMNFLSANPLWW